MTGKVVIARTVEFENNIFEPTYYYGYLLVYVLVLPLWNIMHTSETFYP